MIQGSSLVFPGSTQSGGWIRIIHATGEEIGGDNVALRPGDTFTADGVIWTYGRTATGPVITRVATGLQLSHAGGLFNGVGILTTDVADVDAFGGLAVVLGLSAATFAPSLSLLVGWVGDKSGTAPPTLRTNWQAGANSNGMQVRCAGPTDNQLSNDIGGVRPAAPCRIGAIVVPRIGVSAIAASGNDAPASNPAEGAAYFFSADAGPTQVLTNPMQVGFATLIGNATNALITSISVYKLSA